MKLNYHTVKDLCKLLTDARINIRDTKELEIVDTKVLDKIIEKCKKRLNVM